MKKMSLFVLVLVVFILSAAPVSAEKIGKLLFVPTVPMEGADLDKIEKVDKAFGSSLKSFKPFEVDNIDDFRGVYGDKRTDRLMLCGAEKACVLKLMRGTRYDLVVIGQSKYQVKKRRYAFKYVVVNLKDGEEKRSKAFGLSPKDPYRARNQGRKWTKRLLVPPQPLLKVSEFVDDSEDMFEEDIEPDPVVAVPVRKAKKKAKPRRKLPTADDVRNELKKAYLAFVDANLKEARQRARKAVTNRCACDADSQALALKGLLDAFASTNGKVEHSLATQNANGAVAELEELGALEKQVVAEGKKIGIDKPSKFRDEMPKKFAEANLIEAEKFVREAQFVKAKASFNRVLEYDPQNAKAKAGLNKMPKHAKSLLMQGSYMIDFDPEGATAKLKQVLELTEPGSDLHKKAQKKLSEIE